MSLAIWPPNFPQCLEPGYTYDLPDPRIATPNAAGPEKVRSRSAAAVIPVQGTVSFKTRETVAQFLTFWRVDLNFGSLMFEWVDPLLLIPCKMQFATKTAPQVSNVSTRRWQAALSLVIMPGAPS